MTADGLAFSPDGTYVAITSDVDSVRIWDWRKHTVEVALPVPRGGGGTGTEANQLSYSQDGNLLVHCVGRGGDNVVVRIWDVRNVSKEDVIDNGPGTCKGAAMTLDERFVVFAMERVIQADELVAYSMKTASVAWRVPLNVSPEFFALSPDREFVAISGRAKSVTDSENGNRAGPLRPIEVVPQVAIVSLSQQKIVHVLRGSAVGPPTWSPDSTKLAIAGQAFVDIFVTVR